MKILLAAHVFSPSVGGVESSSLDLALAFAKAGHEVQILTQTPSNNPKDDHGLKVIRQPRARDLFRAIKWCHVYFQNNISLHTAWPSIFIRRPWVVSTQTWIKNVDGSRGVGTQIKNLALRFATNVYISRAVRDHVGKKGVVIPNPYDSRTFRIIPGIARQRSLVFLGRLVSDKGCDLLIQSLAKLRDAGFVPQLTIIGTGSEEEDLRDLVQSEKLNGQVHFVGALQEEELAKELNRHQILVVPSRWEEPFGIVALEGIACGCLAVGSESGGLPDAIGPCGVTFENEDVAGLARAIQKAFEKRESLPLETISNHLESHRAEAIAGRYLELFKSLCSNGRSEENYKALENKAFD